MKKTSILFMVNALLVPAVLMGGYLIYKNNAAKLPIFGPYDKGEKGKAVLRSIPDFEFTDQNNELFSSDEVKDKIKVINFFFTSCPSICPRMNKNVQLVQQVFIDDKNVEFISFTVDPERDNPEKLKSYADAYSLNEDQWHFLTGKKEDLYVLANAGFRLTATDADGDSTDFIHSQTVLLVDPDGRIRGLYEGTKEKEVTPLVNDINRLKKEYKKS